MMKRFLLIFAIAGSAFAQAPRPPIQKLSGLTGDVLISSPTDDQPLVYDSASGKWGNSSTLDNIIIQSTTDAGTVANFQNAELISPFAGTLLDWTAGLYFQAPIKTSAGVISVDPNARILYGTDGTTEKFRWDSTGVRFPQLTTNGYLKVTGANGTVDVDSGTLGGNFVVGPLSSTDGNVPLWDGVNGNLLKDSTLNVTSTRITMFNLSGSGVATLRARNDFSSTTSASAVENYVDEPPIASRFITFSQSYTPTGIITGGDTEVRSAGSFDLILSTGGVIRFSNDSSATESFTLTKVGFGGRTSVTSTVDQTATSETSHISFTVPANSVAAGTTFRITAWGNMDNGTTAITFTPRIRWGGTGGTQLIATPTVVGTTTAQNNKGWMIEALVTVRTTGASGSCSTVMAVENHTASSSGAWARDQADVTPTTIDTTAAKDLVLSWALSATTGTPHVRTTGGAIEVVKP